MIFTADSTNRLPGTHLDRLGHKAGLGHIFLVLAEQLQGVDVPNLPVAILGISVRATCKVDLSSRLLLIVKR